MCGILTNISESIVSQRKGVLSQSVDTISKPCTYKHSITKATDWEKDFANHKSDKGIESKIEKKHNSIRI